MSHHILSVNPGSTSTKIALFRDETEIFRTEIKAPAGHGSPAAQAEHITAQVIETLAAHSFLPSALSAVVGRGGMLPPVKVGGYLVGPDMLRWLAEKATLRHASNLGAPVAYAMAAPLGIPAYVYDCVSSDEMWDMAKITGIPELSRQSFCHVLNAKAAARMVAERQGKRYDTMHLIVAHLGGGISVSAHACGRMVDVIPDDAGHFSPERAGGAPLSAFAALCYSGTYSEREMDRKLRGHGGLKAHLGTSDCIEIEARIAGGDAIARQVYEAMAYTVAKSIGMLSVALGGRLDAIILTGGLANSNLLTGMIIRYVSFLAPVERIPGEHEMEALALGALRLLRGEETPHVFTER